MSANDPAKDTAATDDTAAADPAAADPPPYGEEPHNPEDDALDAKRMTLLEHLSELRVRLRNAAIVFVVTLLAAFFFVQKFFVWLVQPVMDGLRRAQFNAEMQFLGVTETFWVFMKLAIVLGTLVASPLIFWELWKFVAPGLYKKEKKLALTITGATAICFIGGAAFGYYLLVEPATYYMFNLGKVEGLEIKQGLTMEHVANFLMLMLAGTGVAFELPIVLAILGWLGIVGAKGLWKFNKYALVLSVVAGGVLTPSADPFTQMLLAGPLFLLYNISIVVVHLIEKARKKELEDLEKQWAEEDEREGKS